MGGCSRQVWRCGRAEACSLYSSLKVLRCAGRWVGPSGLDLEKLLLKRIYNDTNFQDWIPLHQFGFQKAQSTIQQCHSLTDIINKALGDQEYYSAVFLDVSQAFDKEWHQGLLIKIKQTIPPPAYFNLLRSYLRNRYFVTTYNNETSPQFPMVRVSSKEASWVRTRRFGPEVHG